METTRNSQLVTRNSILLLGGSFNPAHAGHLYISREVMKRLGVKETWWLVSPGNPLKDAKEMAAFEVRLKKAKDVARADRRIKVSGFEAYLIPPPEGGRSGGGDCPKGKFFIPNHLPLTSPVGESPPPNLPPSGGGKKVYTIDTIRALKQRYPRYRFIWMMGADNLGQFHRWKEWEKIFALVPVVVVDRAPFSVKALRSKAAARFSGFRQKAGQSAISGNKKPIWNYIFLKTHPLSATSLRKRLGKDAFLVHN